MLAHRPVGSGYPQVIHSQQVTGGKDGCHRLMEDACTAARVQLGANDHRILIWLAGWEQRAPEPRPTIEHHVHFHGVSAEDVAAILNRRDDP